MRRLLSYRRVAALCLALSLPLSAQESNAELAKEVADLRALVQKLQERVNVLESASAQPAAQPTPVPATPVQPAPVPDTVAAVPAAPDFLHGTTINVLFDGYYGYNFNDPIGRVNLLRAYDVSSNAFSINQADVVIENAPDPANGKRFGLRLDLQYGQATETLQGNPANEPRPDVYRAIFQAYGTYVIPIGNGLTVDFGKWASSLGIENNYTKDQMNYSRSLLFNALPFYHMGARLNYKINDEVAVSYWITNGTQQTEPYNGFKDQFFGIALQPRKTVSWNINYYLGQEHPDVIFYPNGGAPAGSPTEQGLPFQPIDPAANGKLHIFDTYMTWQARPKLTVAFEGDYLIERLWNYSAPSHIAGGAGYIQYQFTPKFSLAGRAEYLSDRDGLFSGTDQTIKETTVTAEYKLSTNFLLMEEWRRDFSNRPFFLTGTLNILKKEQNTATLGLVWWFGRKQGAW